MQQHIIFTTAFFSVDIRVLHYSLSSPDVFSQHFSRILPSFPDAPAKYWSVEWRRVAGLQLTANLFRSSQI
ncbi:hypothetical protein T4A_7030 [Trichinella pseudospiralis]|uniref:Uncharacterized protein n=1 Tax=Trichinella pseudospiralis TaxID=6337 RepID=A0A0V1DYS2_TRIPS|nr:hypothetical protein T4A_7030 [Trichinella pseudospiralis]